MQHRMQDYSLIECIYMCSLLLAIVKLIAGALYTINLTLKRCSCIKSNSFSSLENSDYE